MNRARRLKAFRETKYSNKLLGYGKGISRQKFWRDVILTIGNDSILTLFGIIGGILAARLLGPAGRGEMAAATVWAAVLGIVASLGLTHALTFFAARAPEEIGHIFVTTLIIWIVQSVVILILGWAAITVLLSTYQPTVVASVRIYLFSVPCWLITVYLANLAQGLEDFVLFNGLRFAAAASYMGGLILASLLNWDQANEVMALLLAAQVVVAIIALVIFLMKIRPRGEFKWRLMIDILKYGLKDYAGNLSWLANSRLDQFIMSALILPSDLGLYAVAVSYAILPLSISSSLATVLFPNVANNGSAEGTIAIFRTLKVNLVLSVGIALIMMLIGPMIIPFVFGPGFQQSVYPATILLVGTVLLGCNYILANGLRGLGYPQLPSLAEVVALGVTLAGLALFLLEYGIMGAAWVSVTAYAVATGILVVGLRIVSRRTTPQP